MVHKTDSAFFLSAMAAPVALTCCTLPWQWAAAALAMFGVVVTLFRHLANGCDIFQGLACLPVWLRGKAGGAGDGTAGRPERPDQHGHGQAAERRGAGKNGEHL